MGNWIRSRSLVAWTVLAGLATAQERTPTFPGDLPPQPDPPPGVLDVQDLEDGLSLTFLVREIVGPGVFVDNIRFEGTPNSIGQFTGGQTSVDMTRGIVLSTGRADSIVGPINQSDGISSINGTPGDADLDAIVDPFPTFDATSLEFDFVCDQNQTIEFSYVLASEEYSEWVDFFFNDTFAFFLNGENIALVPGTNEPVGILSINCGSPYDPPVGGPNCDLFLTNNCNDIGGIFPCGGGLAMEMDGRTTVLTAVGELQPGTNTIKLVVADVFDGVFDTNVLLQAQTFDCALGDPFFIPPSPCGETTFVTAGSPVAFVVSASATHGGVDQCITLDVSGDPAPLGGGTFTPSLPSACEQPATTAFNWTPGIADIGEHTLVFTATDDLGQVTLCETTISVVERIPEFLAPTPCGQTLMVSTGNSIEFSVAAEATYGDLDSCVSLSVAGDDGPLLGGTFSPTLPTACAQPATTTFSWTPTIADIGQHTLIFSATDDIGQTNLCQVTIEVAECFLLVGMEPAYEPLPMGGPEDWLYVRARAVYPVTMEEIPTFDIPDLPGAVLQRLYFQVTMVNPFADPLDPVRASNGLEVRMNGPSRSYGQDSGITLRALTAARPGHTLRLGFTIDGF